MITQLVSTVAQCPGAITHIWLSKYAVLLPSASEAFASKLAPGESHLSKLKYFSLFGVALTHLLVGHPIRLSFCPLSHQKRTISIPIILGAGVLLSLAEIDLAANTLGMQGQITKPNINLSAALAELIELLYQSLNAATARLFSTENLG